MPADECPKGGAGSKNSHRASNPHWTVLVVALIVLVLLAIIELVGRAAPKAVAT